MYLVPLVLIVTSAEGETERERREGVRKVAISGSRRRGWGHARGDYSNSMCSCDDFLLKKR